MGIVHPDNGDDLATYSHPTIPIIGISLIYHYHAHQLTGHSHRELCKHWSVWIRNLVIWEKKRNEIVFGFCTRLDHRM
jgi:hypothetical protein